MEAQPDTPTDGKNPDFDHTLVTNGSSLRGKKFEEGEIVGGRYKIIAVIGEGGNGVVYRVRQIFLEKDMALKTIYSGHDSDNVIKRFQQEAKTTSSLEHPNLINVKDFGVLHDNRPFLVMDFADGNSLAQVFRKKGSLSQDELISVFSKVLEGLAYAHDNGIIHRDIKPSNIMFLDDGAKIDSVKIIDFGIAKIATSEGGEIQSLTRTGEIFGSPLYMSPEQCLGQKVDSRSDLYSLGCVMFEALTGAPPFVGETALLTLMKHTTEAPPSLREGSLGKEFSEELERIVAKMLKKTPDERYQDARAVAAELLSLQNPDRDRHPAKETKPNRIQNRTKVWGLVSVLVLTSLISIPFILDKLQTPQNAPKIIPTQAPIQSVDSPSKNNFLLTTVYKNADGQEIRRCHIPKNLGKITLYDPLDQKNRDLITSDFEIPATTKFEVQFENETIRNNPELLSGFDDQAILKLTLEHSVLDNTLLFRISQMKALTYLDLKYSTLSDKDIKYINEIPTLLQLHLDGSKVTEKGVLQLRRLNNLTALTLESMEKGGKSLDGEIILDGLKNNKVMYSLGLIGASIDGTNIEKILYMPTIASLDLAGNAKIQEKDIEKLLPLKNLRSLDLRNCEFSPKSFTTFKQFPKLRELQIGGGSWGSAERHQFQTALGKHCQIKFYRNGIGREPATDYENDMLEDLYGDRKSTQATKKEREQISPLPR